MADTIPLQYAQSLLRLVPMPQAALREELNRLKLPLVLLQDTPVSKAQISADDYGRLFVHLVRRLQKQIPADRGGGENALVFSAYQMMFQAMLHASDLEQALQRASLYFQRLQADGESFYIEEDGDEVRCRFEFSEDNSRTLSSPENYSMGQLNWLPGQTGKLVAMAMWHRVCSWFIGSYIELISVEMRQIEDPGNMFAEFFGAPVTFSAQRDAICFHRRYLRFPIVQSEDSLEQMLNTYPAELMKINAGEGDLKTRVKSLIGTNFQRELPSLQEISDRLHMTTPTLHRRLGNDGTSYQKLKDECRRDAAIEYLKEGNITTAQLAERMGFSDSSTFHRAFKKWTGKTPQQYS